MSYCCYHFRYHNGKLAKLSCTMSVLFDKKYVECLEILAIEKNRTPEIIDFYSSEIALKSAMKKIQELKSITSEEEKYRKFKKKIATFKATEGN